MTRDPVALAEIEHDRRESEPFYEDEAERFWLEHDRYMAGYYEARMQPGAALVPPEEWEKEINGRST